MFSNTLTQYTDHYKLYSQVSGSHDDVYTTEPAASGSSTIDMERKSVEHVDCFITPNTSNVKVPVAVIFTNWALAYAEGIPEYPEYINDLWQRLSALKVPVYVFCEGKYFESVNFAEESETHFSCLIKTIRPSLLSEEKIAELARDTIDELQDRQLKIIDYFYDPKFIHHSFRIYGLDYSPPFIKSSTFYMRDLKVMDDSISSLRLSYSVDDICASITRTPEFDVLVDDKCVYPKFPELLSRLLTLCKSNIRSIKFMVSDKKSLTAFNLVINLPLMKNFRKEVALSINIFLAFSNVRDNHFLKPNVTELSLINTTVEDIFSAVDLFQNIKKLTIEYNDELIKIPQEKFEGMLQKLPSLASLKISGNLTIIPAAGKSASVQLPALTELVVISGIHNVQIFTSDFFNRLLLAGRETLTYLKLMFCHNINFPPAGLTNLQELDLYACTVDDAGLWQTLANSKIVSLTLEDNKYLNKQPDLPLLKFDHLVEAEVIGKDVSEDTQVHINCVALQAVIAAPKLYRLKLSRVFRIFLEPTFPSCAVKILQLEGLIFTSDSFAILSYFPQLEELSLDGVEFPANGFASIPDCPKVLHLIIKNCTISAAAWSDIVTVMPACATLRVDNVVYDPVGFESVASFPSLHFAKLHCEYNSNTELIISQFRCFAQIIKNAVIVVGVREPDLSGNIIDDSYDQEDIGNHHWPHLRVLKLENLNFLSIEFRTSQLTSLAITRDRKPRITFLPKTLVDFNFTPAQGVIMESESFSSIFELSKLKYLIIDGNTSKPGLIVQLHSSCRELEHVILKGLNFLRFFIADLIKNNPGLKTLIAGTSPVTPSALAVSPLRVLELDDEKGEIKAFPPNLLWFYDHNVKPVYQEEKSAKPKADRDNDLTRRKKKFKLVRHFEPRGDDISCHPRYERLTIDHNGPVTFTRNNTVHWVSPAALQAGYVAGQQQEDPNSEEKNYYSFNTLTLVVGGQPQPLPSNTANRTIVALAKTSDVPVIVYQGSDDRDYVALGEGVTGTHVITFYQHTLGIFNLYQIEEGRKISCLLLLNMILDTIKFSNGENGSLVLRQTLFRESVSNHQYRELMIAAISAFGQPEEGLAIHITDAGEDKAQHNNDLLDLKIGPCRHRAELLFDLFTAKHMFDLEFCRTVRSGSHRVFEYKLRGNDLVMKVNAGGYSGSIEEIEEMQFDQADNEVKEESKEESKEAPKKEDKRLTILEFIAELSKPKKRVNNWLLEGDEREIESIEYALSTTLASSDYFNIDNLSNISKAMQTKLKVFLEAKNTKGPRVLAINLARLANGNMAFNEMFAGDADQRYFNGMPIPKDVRIICFIPTPMLGLFGRDVYRRLPNRARLNLTQVPNPIDAIPTVPIPVDGSCIVIDFYEGLNWFSKLNPRALLPGQTVHLINAPWNKKEFRIEMRNLIKRRIEFTKRNLAYNFSQRKLQCETTDLRKDYSGIYVLNQETFKYFVNNHESFDSNGRYVRQSSILARHHRGSLTIRVTRTLPDIKYWAHLFAVADENMVQLKLLLDPGVVIPTFTYTEQKSTEPVAVLPQKIEAFTSLFFADSRVTVVDTPSPDETVQQLLEAKKIDKDCVFPVNKEHGAHDVLSYYDMREHKNDVIKFIINEVAQRLIDGKTVVLKGDISDALAQQLETLLAGYLYLNGKRVDVAGKLIIVGRKIIFPGTNARYQHALKDKRAIQQPLSQELKSDLAIVATEDKEVQRINSVIQKLSDFPVAVLEGDADFDANAFVLEELRSHFEARLKKNIRIFNGIEKLNEYLEFSAQKANAAIQCILWVDEATKPLEENALAKLQGIFDTIRPGILSRNFYRCRPNMKILLAANPKSQMKSVVREFAQKFPTTKLTIEPLSDDYLASKLLAILETLLPELKTEYLQILKEFYNYTNRQRLIKPVTQRNREMMCLRFAWLWKHHKNNHSLSEIAQYAAWQELDDLTIQDRSEAKEPLTEEKLSAPAQFNLKLHEELLQFIESELKKQKKSFILTSSRRQMVAKMLGLLEISYFRQQHPGLSSRVGMRGIVWSGESAYGKTALAEGVFAALKVWCEQNPDRAAPYKFDVVVLKANDSNLEQQIFDAFHQGKKVFIDEYNTAAIEEILSCYLAGHNKFGNKPTVEGFEFFGMMNPPHYQGGRALFSQTFKYRYQTCKVKNYTPSEVAHIVRSLGVDEKDAPRFVNKYVELSAADFRTQPIYTLDDLLEEVRTYLAERQRPLPSAALQSTFNFVSASNDEKSAINHSPVTEPAPVQQFLLVC